MKTILSMLLLLLAGITPLTAQKNSVIKSDAPITWLGLDFTMMRFIGDANQFKDAGEITPAAMREKYMPGWNQLFINEQKKYDVAKYLRRESVAYALEVTNRANENSEGKIFSDDPGDFSRLKESDINAAVKKYDFKGKNGIGLLFFIEGMSKGKESASAWITFVDMGNKTVLKTSRVTGDAGGFGFRNYWAKAFLNILKQVDDN